MSYMNHNFAASSGIEELDFREMDQVNGGKGVAALLFSLNQPVGGVIFGLVELGWDAAHNRAE